MKHSYYQTPRTLQDSVFISSADPYETFSAPSRGLSTLFYATSVIAVLTATLVIIL